MLGSGTELDPYQVETAEDLDDVRNNLSAYYIQMADIDLISYTNWVPIGDEDTPFTGQYDGGNFNIFNMTINTSANFTGLFGHVNTDTTTSISNVNMVDIDIKTSGDMVGALVGQLAGGNITNCHSSGLIETTITNSIYDIGGLIGYILYLGDEENKTITIANCSSSVSIHGDFSTAENYSFLEYCGGLIGSAEGYWVNIYITDCFSTGDIKQIAPLVPNSKKFGFYACGGFIGYTDESSDYICKISKCYSTGDISTGWACGGFVGCLYSEAINCYSLGNVLVPEGFEAYDKYNDCGGFCGEYWSCLITNCYTTGDVTGISWDDEGTFAAFTPWGSISDLINCYYNSDLSSRTDDIVIPKTTLEMKTQSTYENWDFITIWKILPSYNNGYPCFNIKEKKIIYMKSMWI